MVKENRPVILLARTGHIIRNMLLGTFAENVCQKAPLIACVITPKDPELRKIAEKKCFSLSQFIESNEHEGRVGKNIYCNVNHYMYRLIQTNKNSVSLKLQTKLFEAQSQSIPKIWIKILLFIGHAINLLRLRKWLISCYLKYIESKKVTQKWIEFFKETKPAIVVSTMLTHSTLYSFSVDLPAVLAARSLNIPVGSLVQSWDNLSSKAALLPSFIDRYWVWSETMKKELLDLNPDILPEKVVTTGAPQFDKHLDKTLISNREFFIRNYGLESDKPYLLLGTGTYNWFPDEPEHTCKLIGAIKKKIPDCQILLRLHPKDNAIRWNDYMNNLKEMGVNIQKTSPTKHMDAGGFIPPEEFFKEQVNAIYHAAVVINTASTLTIDASILNRPVICIGFDLCNDSVFPEGRCYAYSKSSHYSHLVNSRGVRVVYSLDECLQSIKQYLNNDQLDELGRKKIVKIVTDKVDGGAGKRLAESTINLSKIYD